MFNLLMGLIMGSLFGRLMPTFVTARLSSNNLASAHAVSNGSPTGLPAQVTPVVVYVNIPPQAQVPSNAQPAPTNPQVPAATAAQVNPPPLAPQPVIWPYMVAIAGAILALLAFIVAVNWVNYNTDPMRDFEAVMVMGGNEVAHPEFVRYVKDDGTWTPGIRFDYDPTVLSLHDNKDGAAFRVLPGWEMETITDTGTATFRGGEMHRSTVAFFHREPYDATLFWQRLLRR